MGSSVAEDNINSRRNDDSIDNNNISNEETTMKTSAEALRNLNQMTTKSVPSDQLLICKTLPQETTTNNNNNSLRSSMDFDETLIKKGHPHYYSNHNKINSTSNNNSLFYLGLMQIIFGILMVIFGVQVLVHHASLAHIGGGLWGGFLSISTGITGVFASTNSQWCPAGSRPKKALQTAFLALNLLSLAVAQLVVALAATGLDRDVNMSKIDMVWTTRVDETNTTEITTTTIAPVPPLSVGKISLTLPANYMSLLANIGLLVVAVIECILAATASYKSARVLCSCCMKYTRSSDDYYQRSDDLTIITNRHQLVSSWLGKHNQNNGGGHRTPPQLYVVTTTPPGQSQLSASSLQRTGSKMGTVFAFPPPPAPPTTCLRYPLIPAPLGTIPSPIIPPPPRKITISDGRRRYPKQIPHGKSSSSYQTVPVKRSNNNKNRKASRKSDVTDADVARTYTGLDKTIAEEFINICDSRNATAVLSSLDSSDASDAAVCVL